MLKVGDKDSKVRELKNGLALLGYLSYDLINDRFDFNCKESVKMFQREEGLKPSGIVNEETWATLNKAVWRKENERTHDNVNVRL